MRILKGSCGWCKNPKNLAKWTFCCFEGKGFNWSIEGDNNNHLFLDHSKRIISHGCLMLHLVMVFVTRLKLQSFHGINLNILCKGNQTNVQGRRCTSFTIPQTYWHTYEPILYCLILGEEIKNRTFDLCHNLYFALMYWLKFP